MLLQSSSNYRVEGRAFELTPHLKPAFAPVADESAVVLAGNARFTILTDRLIRMEYDALAKFEDRPSLAFWYRRQPVPKFKVERNDGILEICTSHLCLRYQDNSNGFTRDNLQVKLLTRESGTVWHFGDTDEDNLGGTLRTLDAINGAIPLSPGLMSRSGWSVVDDSDTPIFNEKGLVEPRDSKGALDLYFFGYGKDFQQCLCDYCAVSGAIPLPPRFVFGNWWSRYWEYSEEELLHVVEGFKQHDIPLSVCVIDMDWHIVKNPYNNGWTGYSWNRELFPDPRRLLSALHAYGLKIALNLHPHEGVHPHEEAYADFAKFMDIDLSTQRAIKFNITNPRFIDGYFHFLHHPREEEGIDFWWIDWQQGTQSPIAGLDPLWWLNHLHALDSQRDGRRRPIILSRWAGWGNQRYPIAFSGDTVISWESLAFQPYFTATAANVACCFWSHDIGGHMFGVDDPELYVRWIQWGVFSPVLRIHATKSRFLERRPWMRGCECLHVGGEFLRLRHRMIPYLYSAAYLTHVRTIPITRPLYWEWPEREEAYSFGNEYFFGSSLLVAPVTVPRHPETRCARQVVWLPPGGWYDFFSGEYFVGDRVMSMQCTLETIPVFAREGAIVPLDSRARWETQNNPTELEVMVFTGSNGAFELFEDDGETQLPLQAGGSITRLCQEIQGNEITFTIEAAQGNRNFMPPRRCWRIVFFGVPPEIAIQCYIGNQILNNVPGQYDTQRECVSVFVESVPVSEKVTVRLSAPFSTHCRRDRANERLERMIHEFHLDNESKERIYDAAMKVVQNPARLQEIGAYTTTAQIQALCEHVFEAGFDQQEMSGTRGVIFWNNKQDPTVTRFFHKGGGGRPEIVPRFERLILDPLLGRTWKLAFCWGNGLLINAKGNTKKNL